MRIQLKKVGSLVWESLARTSETKFGKTLWTLFSGNVGGFIMYVNTSDFEWSISHPVIWSGLILLILIFAYFFLTFSKNFLSYWHSVFKDSKYGDAIILLKESFAKIHLYRKTPEFDDEDFMEAVLRLCNNLKIIFDSITGSKCSVSIKVPVNEREVQSYTRLQNLARDTEHSNRDTEDYKNAIHTVSGNTPFSFCANRVAEKKNKKYYIHDNINSDEQYDSTSRPLYRNGVLPYESELVHPIYPAHQADGVDVKCLGFICIDTEKAKAFDKKYCTAIIEGVADGIYDIIEQFNNTQNEQQTN